MYRDTLGPRFDAEARRYVNERVEEFRENVANEEYFAS